MKFPIHPQNNQQRQQWMALLARSSVGQLEASLRPYLELSHQMLKEPQTGLIMVQGRMGATGQRFNMGEMTVCRCVLQVEISTQTPTNHQQVGVAYIKGGLKRHAFLAAFADALLQEPAYFSILQQSLLTPILDLLNQQSQMKMSKTLSSRVEFFTVARQSAGMSDEQSA
jgi:alpha-D-ribose 1-methylphosphonate 5-triphosphate synthase subunit PhnG